MGCSGKILTISGGKSEWAWADVDQFLGGNETTGRKVKQNGADLRSYTTKADTEERF